MMNGMAGRKLRTKILLVLLSVVLVLALVAAAMPLWFPWVLPPIAKRCGAAYAGYHRLGYQQFELSGFTLTNGATHLDAGEVRAFIPTVWLWKHFTGAHDRNFLQVQSWKYESVPAKSSPGTNAPASAQNTFRELQNLATKLRNWLPAAKLDNGTVVIDRQNLKIDGAIWTNGTLSATLTLSNEPPVSVSASTTQHLPWTLRIDSEPEQFHSVLLMDERDGQLAVTGTADWRTNHMDIAAAFPAHGFVPETASVRADAFKVPARLFGLREYGDIGGSLQADWQTNHFNVQLAAHTASPSTNLPPLNLELRVSGDTNAAQLQVAKISAPALQGELAAPIAVHFHPPYLSQPATLNVAADLDQQHWFVAQGKLTGQAVIYPVEKIPRVSFTLTGRSVTTTSITSSNLAVEGELTWPVLDLKNAHVELGDQSTVSLSGQYDIAQKIVRDGHLDSSGTFGGQFLPAGYSFRSASITAQFTGPLTSITNSATAHVKEFKAPELNAVDADIAWNGEGLNFRSAQMALKAGQSSLELRASARLARGDQHLTLTAFELSRSNQVALHLEQPVQITLTTNAQTTNSAWDFGIAPISLTGNGREVRVAGNVSWPQRGTIQCEAHGLDARLLRDFIPRANMHAVLNDLDFAGGWTNGPVAFQLTSDATVQTKEDFPFSANAKLSGGKDGISIEQFSVSSATQIVCRAEGTFPISLDPTRKDGMMQIDTQAPLKLHAFTAPKSVLWEKIAETTGLQLREPDLSANLEGTWAAPQGRVTLQVQRISLSGLEHIFPSMENMDLLAVLDRATARMTRCNFDIEKQPVSITGEIPLGDSFWGALLHKQHLPDWRQASAHLVIAHAQLAPFASLLPQILSPQGTLSADISLQPGGNFQGQLSVTDARTHPLESIGPVRNIQLLARLDGRQLRLENASGEIGGQRVTVEGAMEITEQIWRTNGIPPFQVHLIGTNVPLARNPSVLLRADLDLAATNSGTEIPIVSGKVKLRDSLYLADLQTLVPEHTASARVRPPYFSIETEPWARWRLKVSVQGNSFLQVQTPLFHGKVSTVLSLEGTLKDPVVLGQVRIDPGSYVSFPFSSLDVKQGFISLTSEDPYRPTLFVTAEARRFGYDVKMEVTGPVDEPVVQFSSVPGLSSEEIVLMLTAGEVPRGLGVTTSTEQRASGLAIFVGKNLLSDFGIGGGEDRLTFRSGEEISETGRPTYAVEYKITDKWSIIGEYDRFDQYDLNVKYKLYSK